MGTAEMTELDGRDEMVESEDEEEMRTEEGQTAEREKESLGAGAECHESEARAVEETEGAVGDAGEEREGDTSMEVDTGVEGRAKEGRETAVSELDKREGWPRWLQEVVDMLHRGERGVELETILTKLVKIEKALGFKEEKTVSDH